MKLTFSGEAYETAYRILADMAGEDNNGYVLRVTSDGKSWDVQLYDVRYDEDTGANMMVCRTYDEELGCAIGEEYTIDPYDCDEIYVY